MWATHDVQPDRLAIVRPVPVVSKRPLLGERSRILPRKPSVGPTKPVNILFSRLAGPRGQFESAGTLTSSSLLGWASPRCHLTTPRPALPPRGAARTSERPSISRWRPARAKPTSPAPTPPSLRPRRGCPIGRPSETSLNESRTPNDRCLPYLAPQRARTPGSTQRRVSAERRRRARA